MRIRQFTQACMAISGLALAFAALPASAHEGHPHGNDPGLAPQGPDDRPDWRERSRYAPPPIDPRVREDWLADCRHRLSSRDNGVGGAVIGGVIGGVAGNRIAGGGNRAVGTIAGAAVGAVVGSAIDKAEDRGRERDDCEVFLDSYYAHGDFHPAYGMPYGYGAPMVMVPVMLTPRGKPECRETVEYVYEDLPARRVIRRAPRIVPDKRIRVAPDKRTRS